MRSFGDSGIAGGSGPGRPEVPTAVAFVIAVPINEQCKLNPPGIGPVALRHYAASGRISSELGVGLGVDSGLFGGDVVAGPYARGMSRRAIRTV